ncbi:MAG: hypothetical protein ACI4RF_02030 [Eubacterium sp.]
MKSIIFVISALIFFSGGVWLFGIIEERIPDDNWIIVVCKILAALIGLVIYIAIFSKLAGIFGITWHYPDV